MAASTWSTTDKAANVTLSGSNLIATASSSNTGGVRGKDPKRAGKYYIEFTSTTTQSVNSHFGFAPAVSGLAPNPFPGAVVVSSSVIRVWDWQGNIAVSGAISAAITTGSVVGCAIDLDNRQVWFRNSPAGNWNNSATANPATGVGGLDTTLAGLGGGIDVYPFVALAGASNSITANFGGSSFSGAVPAGFTAGWDDSTAIVTGLVATQAGVEVWEVGNPALVATQIGAEAWIVPNPYAGVSGVIRETLLATDGILRTSGLVRETLRSSGTGVGTYLAVDGVVREVLRSRSGVGVGGAGGGPMISMIM